MYMRSELHTKQLFQSRTELFQSYTRMLYDSSLATPSPFSPFHLTCFIAHKIIKEKMANHTSDFDLLLEHCLMTHKKSSSSCSSPLDNANKRHRVVFSQCSQLHVYDRDDLYLKNMAYSKYDRDIFGQEAVREGMRIKNLIEAVPSESVAESIKYLIRHGVITRSELIGIEHYVFSKPNRILKVRREHSAAVLWKQYEQRQQKVHDPMNLGKFAKISSIKSTKRARVRAAMAA